MRPGVSTGVRFRIGLLGAAIVAALVLGPVPLSGGEPPSGFQITIAEPQQEPIGPGDTEVRAQIITSPAQPDVNFLVTMIDPKGRKQEQHGTFDGNGSAVAVFKISRPGMYALKVLAVSSSARETAQSRFEAQVIGAQAFVVLDGPGEGVILHSPSRGTDPRPAITPAVPAYPYADAAGAIEPAGHGCRKPAYHGDLFGFGDPRPGGCGWGTVAYLSDGTLLLKYIAGAMVREIWARHVVADHVDIAFRGIEEAAGAMDGVDSQLVHAGASLRLSHQQTAVLRHEVASANADIRTAFFAYRRLFQGGAHLDDRAIAINHTESALLLERKVLDSLRARRLLLKSDAPEFDATITGAFINVTTSLVLRLHTEPPQESAPYVVEITQPDGTRLKRTGRLDNTGRVTITVPTGEPDAYLVKATVVGADPVTDTFNTGTGCPGRYRETTGQTADGSQWPNGVVPLEDTLILPGCIAPGGQPRAVPTVAILSADTGGSLNVTDAKLSTPFENNAGNEIYNYSANLQTGGAKIRWLAQVSWP